MFSKGNFVKSKSYIKWKNSVKSKFCSMNILISKISNKEQLS